MLQQVKAELKNGIAASAQFVEETLERHVHFSNHLLESSLASAKAMRTCSTMSEALKIPPKFVTETQKDLLALGYSNAQAAIALGKRCVSRIRQGLTAKKMSAPATDIVSSVLPPPTTTKKSTARTKKAKTAS